MTGTPDLRPLHVRVRALAQRFDAIAIGADKQPHVSKQVGENARRDADVLHVAAKLLEARG